MRIMIMEDRKSDLQKIKVALARTFDLHPEPRHKARVSPFGLRSGGVLTLPLILTVGKDTNYFRNDNGICLKLSLFRFNLN